VYGVERRPAVVFQAGQEVMNSLFSSEKIKSLARFFWGAALVTLPVTSFRYFPGLGDTTYVRPLAIYPLILLLVILVVQLFRRKIASPWPGGLIVFGMFLLVLLVTSILGVLYAPMEMRGQVYWSRAIRAWVTVLIGLSFFVAAIWTNGEEGDLRFSLRWLGIGLLLDILWSGLQAVTFYTPLLDKVIVTHWQLAFSMRELVKTNRISGLAYEPAWLAGQIATVYLPWLFAAVMTKTRLTRFRWLETLVLGLSGLLLLSTYSRGGLVTALCAAFLTTFLLGGQRIRNGWRWFLSGFLREQKEKSAWLKATGIRLATLVIVVIIISGSLVFMAQKNYIARIWNTRAESLADFIIENSAGARTAYAWGALGAYEQHPWVGVGLGASGFYIYDNLPDWALTFVPEIARQLSPANRLYPNPKNLYVRILVETGLIGFSFYLAFIFGLLGDMLILLKRPGIVHFVGVAALFSWLAVAFYNLTQDSFASPNIWINFGILVGLSRNVQKKVKPLEAG
jgi:hypothetical protein